MASLSVFTLGAPRIEIDHRPVEVDTRKAIAMVIYLVVRGESHRREIPGCFALARLRPDPRHGRDAPHPFRIAQSAGRGIPGDHTR